MFKYILSLCLTFIALLYGYKVSDQYFGIYEEINDKTVFVIDSAFDFKECIIYIDVKRVNKIDIHKDTCKFITDKKRGKLICSQDLEYCVNINSINYKTILKHLNNKGIWYVTNVKNNDTLNVREYAGVKYKKLFELPPNTKGLKVLEIKPLKSSMWYKIKYKNPH